VSVDRIRAVADAVLYEGYLLYPYRATSSKNQLRWQFGVLGPQGAEAAGIGEDSHLSMQCLLDLGLLDLGRSEDIESAQADLIIYVRFLQLQQRRTERLDDRDGYLPIPELRVDSERHRIRGSRQAAAKQRGDSVRRLTLRAQEVQAARGVPVRPKKGEVLFERRLLHLDAKVLGDESLEGGRIIGGHHIAQGLRMCFCRVLRRSFFRARGDGLGERDEQREG